MEKPHLGFKTVTIENVLETDPVVAMMVTVNYRTGEVKDQEYGDWVRIVTEIELSAQVPLEVRKAFMFSRDALCYAHWYYPLLTLGMNDMLRVADFAASQSCKERDIDQSVRAKKGGIRKSTLAENIEGLAAVGVIPAKDVRTWGVIREARNHATHPAAHNVFGFPHAYETLKLIRDLINRLDWLPS